MIKNTIQEIQVPNTIPRLGTPETDVGYGVGLSVGVGPGTGGSSFKCTFGNLKKNKR